MIDDDHLDEGRQPPGSRNVIPIHDWRLRERKPDAEIKWPELWAFDSLIRERLTEILVRREAERATERGISSGERAKLWRSRLKARRQEFAEALELKAGPAFSLDWISPSVPADQRVGRGNALCSNSDRAAGFDPDEAAFFCNALGPAAVVVQPHFESYGYARHFGDIEFVTYFRRINIFELPPLLGWISPKRQPLLWVR